MSVQQMGKLFSQDAEPHQRQQTSERYTRYIGIYDTVFESLQATVVMR